MAYPQLNPRHTPNARVEEISHESGHYRLSIPAGHSNSYRLAQLDDYFKLPRKKFSHHALTLSLSARTSSSSIAGTWGFGLWNDPFGLSLGFGGNPFQLPALPNAAWFFGASKENYLSFKSGQPQEGRAQGGQPQGFVPTSGFMAQTFRSPKFHPWLILAGLILPFSRKLARRLLGRVIAEDGVQLWNQGASPWRRGDTRSRNFRQQAVGLQSQSLSVDPTRWRRYSLTWSLKRVSFEVDEVQVFESAMSPNPPLGLVIWIDNQYAAFTPEGKIAFGVLENPEPAWLEIRELEMRD